MTFDLGVFDPRLNSKAIALGLVLNPLSARSETDQFKNLVTFEVIENISLKII